jgi:hypothetical protein
MTAIRKWTGHHELLHWLLVLATAIALTLMVAKILGGAAPMPEPGLLPDEMGKLARPMTPDRVQPFFPESPPGRQLPPAEAAARLWTILEHHRGGRALEAINAWEVVGLPEEMAHWREIAIGAAHLEIGELDGAALHLEAAEQCMPGHALTAFFRGLWRLEQAEAVSRIPDGNQRGDLLVSLTPGQDRAVYCLLAIAELEMAIHGARDVRPEQPLVFVDPLVEQDLIVPTAGDLMAALGADNFVGKAHHALFGLRLDQGELVVAEYHLNAAANTGIAVLRGYQDLAERYLVAGENRQAIRLAMKDIEWNRPELARLIRWLSAMEKPVASWVW